MKIYRFSWLSLILISLLAVGCEQSAKHSNISSPTALSTLASSATPSPTPNLSPSPTSTLPPTRPPTYTPRPPTSTPPPTLAPLKAKEAIIKLIENNGGCRLPCMLGITPGKTERQNARDLLAHFGNDLDGVDNSFHFYIMRGEAAGVSTLDLILVEERVDQPNLDYAFQFYYFYEIPRQQLIKKLILDLNVLENLDIVFAPYFNEVTHLYSLPEILTQYGKPSSVQFAAFHYTSDGYSWPLVLLLIYEKDGFMVEYRIPKERIGDQYQGCPSTSAMVIRSWADTHEGAWQQALPDLRFGLNRKGLIAYFKPLERATSLTLDEFYEIYKIGDDKNCLQTPIELWPNTEP